MSAIGSSTLHPAPVAQDRARGTAPIEDCGPRPRFTDLLDGPRKPAVNFAATSASAAATETAVAPQQAEIFNGHGFFHAVRAADEIRAPAGQSVKATARMTSVTQFETPSALAPLLPDASASAVASTGMNRGLSIAPGVAVPASITPQVAPHLPIRVSHRGDGAGPISPIPAEIEPESVTPAPRTASVRLARLHAPRSQASVKVALQATDAGYVVAAQAGSLDREGRVMLRDRILALFSRLGRAVSIVRVDGRSGIPTAIEQDH